MEDRVKVLCPKVPKPRRIAGNTLADFVRSGARRAIWAKPLPALANAQRQPVRGAEIRVMAMGAAYVPVSR